MGVDLVDITAKRAALTPTRIAFEDVLSGRALTYADLDNRAARCATVLKSYDIKADDRVAVLCRNRIEFFELLFACAKAGAILVPLNWRAPAAELAPVMADCAPKLLFYGAEDAVVAERLEIAKLAFGAPYETALASAPPAQTSALWSADAIWSLIYTSGTTGEPKGVIQTYQMALVNAFHATQAFGIRGGDRTLNFLPLFHTAGIHLLTMPVLMAGGAVRILPSFDAARALALIPELDLFFGVPAVYQQMALHADFARADLGRVRAWGCGGAPLSDALVRAFAVKGAVVCNGYGMTETGPTAFVAAPEDALTKIGSVGKAQMLLQTRIVGADGADVEEGATGEVWMRGPGLTPGYWNKPDITAKTIVDGWLKSGDLGRRDADGCYYIAGRIKEMYISGGENVYPAEVEAVIAAHPSVLEAAVIGVADERWGEVGHAFVMLRPDATPVTAADVIQHCRASLAGYKTPRAVTFVDDFPRTAAGKIRKHLLTPSAPAAAR